MTLFVLPNTQVYSRLGVTATRKMGGAVSRNRAKRRVREIFRTNAFPTGLDMVVVVRRELIEAGWNDLVDEFRLLLRRQGRIGGRSRA
jgi:ribonuclease P protein component